MPRQPVTNQLHQSDVFYKKKRVLFFIRKNVYCNGRQKFKSF